MFLGCFQGVFASLSLSHLFQHYLGACSQHGWVLDWGDHTHHCCIMKSCQSSFVECLAISCQARLGPLWPLIASIPAPPGDNTNTPPPCPLSLAPLQPAAQKLYNFYHHILSGSRAFLAMNLTQTQGQCNLLCQGNHLHPFTLFYPLSSPKHPKPISWLYPFKDPSAFTSQLHYRETFHPEATGLCCCSSIPPLPSALEFPTKTWSTGTKWRNRCLKTIILLWPFHATSRHYIPWAVPLF